MQPKIYTTTDGSITVNVDRNGRATAIANNDASWTRDMAHRINRYEHDIHEAVEILDLEGYVLEEVE